MLILIGINNEEIIGGCSCDQVNHNHNWLTIIMIQEIANPIFQLADCIQLTLIVTLPDE